MSDDAFELRIAWQQHVGTSPVALAWFDRVVARHRAEGRHYHDLHHVCWVVRHVLDLAGHAEDPGAVVAAACFHDVVYDVHRSDNEAVSAGLAAEALAELGWRASRVRHVAAMIAATAGHRVEGTDPDTEVLLAADLAVLAAEPTRYDDYARAVRREYAHLDEGAWRSGRTAVLESLLHRDRLFPERLDLHAWEHRARANITSELASLAD
ncbi:MAG TPA: hypothetical protein VIS05_10230 [Ilumatobacter sp.]